MKIAAWVFIGIIVYFSLAYIIGARLAHIRETQSRPADEEHDEHTIPKA